MKTIFSVTLLILFVFIVDNSCKKTAIDSTSLNNAVPVPTPVGAPVGNPVTVTIGSNGGSILSADSMVELQFPSGALSSNTQITIQPITNNAPNGLGNAYRFLPDGLKFSTPINLIFHYKDTSVAATQPDLLGIAFQDSSGVWYGLSSLASDTINKTNTAAINHFSDWTSFMFLFIAPYSSTLGVSKSERLEINAIDLKDTGSLITPLIAVLPQKLLNQTWSVNGVPNGNATFGTISGSGASRIYTAPSKVTQQNNLALVKVRFNGPFTTKFKTYKNLELKAKIEITDTRKFQMELLYNEDILGTGTGQIYWDSASLNVTKNDDNSFTIDNIQNFSPKVTPRSVVEGNCTITWVETSLGILNIKGGDGYIAYNGSASSGDTVVVNLSNSETKPAFTVACTDGTTHSVSGGPDISSYHFIFNMQDSLTVKNEINRFYYRITRLK